MDEATARTFLLRAIGLVSVGVLLVIAIVFTGALDRFSGATGVPRGLFLQSAALYWVVLCAALWFFVRAFTHRLQMLLALLSLLLSFGFFELAARVLELPAGFLHWDGVPSRTLHHFYPPDRKMYAGIYEDAPVFVITNGDGLRTPYEREEFAQHAERIAVLGDSFTFGFGVSQEHSMPSLLEAELRRLRGDDDLAVLNAGVVSFSPLLEKLLYQDIVRHYEPGSVLMVLDPTDIGDDYKYAREAVEEDGRTVFPRAGPECGEAQAPRYYGAVIEILSPLLRPLKEPLGYPVQVLGPRLGLSVGKGCDYDYYDFQLELGDTLETNRYFHYRHPLERTRRYFDATLQNIQATADAVRADGARFALAVSPRFHHWNPEESPENWERDDYALDEPHQYEYFRYFEEKRSELDFPVFDLLPDFQATDEAPLVFRDDPHWNAAGNRFAARALARHLIRAGWVEAN